MKVTHQGAVGRKLDRHWCPTAPWIAAARTLRKRSWCSPPKPHRGRTCSPAGSHRKVSLGSKCVPTSSVQTHLLCQRTCLARALAAQTRWRSLLPGYIPRCARRSRRLRCNRGASLNPESSPAGSRGLLSNNCAPADPCMLTHPPSLPTLSGRSLEFLFFFLFVIYSMVIMC